VGPYGMKDVWILEMVPVEEERSKEEKKEEVIKSAHIQYRPVPIVTRYYLSKADLCVALFVKRECVQRSRSRI